MKWIQVYGSFLRFLFLVVMMVVNIIGFHYYFKPSAEQSFLHIPNESKFVLSVNLKSISGKLFDLFLFSPDAFEKDIISKEEKKIVLKNASLGIEPFGWVSFFSFPYKNNMLHGVAFNLEDEFKFQENFRDKSFTEHNADDVKIFSGKEFTVFSFGNAAVLLFGKFKSDIADELALKYLQNDGGIWMPENKHDFLLSLLTGVFHHSKMGDFFNLVPETSEGLFLRGSFETGKIEMDGEIKFENREGWLKEIRFSEPELSTTHKMPFLLSIEGVSVKKPLHDFILQLTRNLPDSLKLKRELINGNYFSLSYAMTNFGLKTEFKKDGLFLPEFTSYLSLNNGNMEPGMVRQFSMTRNLSSLNDSVKGDVNLLVSKWKKSIENTAYFYFNPSQFIYDSEISFFIKSFIEPFIVFDEFFVKADEYKDGKLFFIGETTLKDKETHSLVQLRLLFKNLSSFL